MTVLSEASNDKGASDTVGERLRDLRKSRLMSVEDLAALCKETGSPELTANAIYAIENGRKKGGVRTRHVTVDELLALGCALNVSPLILLFPAGAEQQFNFATHTTADDDALWQRLLPRLERWADERSGRFVKMADGGSDG